LVESNRERLAKIERGDTTVVGQNDFVQTEDSPLTTGEDGGILTPDPEVERERIEAVEKWRGRGGQAGRGRPPHGASRGAGGREREPAPRHPRGREGRGNHRRVGRSAA